MATFYVVRHAHAGSREAWSEDDRRRPLTGKGRKQAEALVSTLAGVKLAAVISSPYLRCVQTVRPVALARGLSVEESAALAEGQGLDGAMRFLGDPALHDAVLCTHGDIVWELVEQLLKRRLVKPGQGGQEKGSAWVVEVEDGSLTGARYIPAP
jgi:phosphohistidine phosphatase SixA